MLAQNILPPPKIQGPSVKAPVNDELILPPHVSKTKQEKSQKENKKAVLNKNDTNDKKRDKLKEKSHKTPKDEESQKKHATFKILALMEGSAWSQLLSVHSHSEKVKPRFSYGFRTYIKWPNLDVFVGGVLRSFQGSLKADAQDSQGQYMSISKDTNNIEIGPSILFLKSGDFNTTLSHISTLSVDYLIFKSHMATSYGMSYLPYTSSSKDINNYSNFNYFGLGLSLYLGLGFYKAITFGIYTSLSGSTPLEFRLSYGLSIGVYSL